MSKKVIFVVVMLCTLWIIQGQGQELKISDFRLSKYKVFRTSLSAELNKYYFGDYVWYDINLAPHYRSISDTSEFDWHGYISADRSYEMTSYLFRTYVGVRHYFSNLFLHGQVDFYSWNGYYFHEDAGFWRKVRYGDLEIGCGIGHLREGYFASVALHINEILKEEYIIRENLDKMTLLKIAQLIAKKQGYIIKHDRYEKQMFSELQNIIEGDPVCENSVSAYVLFKIFDIVDHIYPGIPNDVLYWNRQFGTRLSFDLLGTHITDQSQRYGIHAMSNFTLFDSIYYVPGIRAVFDYGNPLSLKSHILGYVSYQIDWYDSVTFHKVRTNFTYSHGVIDHIVFTARLDNYYGHAVNRDTTADGLLEITPEIGLAYYIEDRIRFGVEVGYNYRIEGEYVDPFDYVTEHGFMIDINTRWYIF